MNDLSLRRSPLRRRLAYIRLKERLACTYCGSLTCVHALGARVDSVKLTDVTWHQKER